MSTLSLLLLCVAQIPPSDPWVGTSPETQLKLRSTNAQLSFDWHDEEDRLRGTLTPTTPRAGQPVELLVSVEPMEGAAFEGSVTAALRPLGQVGAAAVMVTIPKPGPTRQWRFELSPLQAGEHVLELRWQTTRMKVVRGKLAVGDGPLPRWFGWALGAVVIVGSIGASAVALLRAKRTTTQGDPPPPRVEGAP
jgi:hypothetical protein